MPFFLLIARFVHSLFRSQRQLVLENLALRQQVVMLRQSVKKPRPPVADKLFWIIFSHYVDGWRKLLHSLHPDTVYAGIYAESFASTSAITILAEHVYR
jgi:hypothetical protein